MRSGGGEASERGDFPTRAARRLVTFSHTQHAHAKSYPARGNRGAKHAQLYPHCPLTNPTAEKMPVLDAYNYSLLSVPAVWLLGIGTHWSAIYLSTVSKEIPKFDNISPRQYVAEVAKLTKTSKVSPSSAKVHRYCRTLQRRIWLMMTSTLNLCRTLANWSGLRRHSRTSLRTLACMPPRSWPATSPAWAPRT